jgi:hypothetical protein
MGDRCQHEEAGIGRAQALIIDYLRERQPTVDHATLRSLSRAGTSHVESKKLPTWGGKHVPHHRHHRLSQYVPNLPAGLDTLEASRPSAALEERD